MISLQAQAEAIAASYIPPAVGRPSDIADAELLKQLFQAIKDGNYIDTACDLVGLSVVSVHTWKKRGEAGERPFAAFAKALKEASAQAEAQAVANVRKAGQLPQFWAAEMTYLERRHPEKWGRRQESDSGPKVVVQIGVGLSDVQVKVISASPDQVSPPTFAHDSPEQDTCNSLQTQAFALPLRPISSVMLTNPEASLAPTKPIGDSLRTDPRGDPTGVEAVAGAVSPCVVERVSKVRRVSRKEKRVTGGRGGRPLGDVLP